MELWIRSQLKGSLIKINDLRIMQLDKDGFKALTEEEAKNGWCIIANDDPCIGTYETKERALEVLDEIQNLLKPPMIIQKTEGVIATTDNTMHIINPTYGEIKQLSTIVYEMPEE